MLEDNAKAFVGSEQVGEWKNVHRVTTNIPAHILKEADLKQDTDKARWDLLPIPAMQEVVRIYTFGAKKYAPNSWKQGMKYSRVYAALLRHVTSWWQGETFDKESGTHHLAHAAWNCLTLISYDLFGSTYKQHDDRPCEMYERSAK